MNFFKTAIAVTALSTLALSAQAQESGAYINLGAQSIELDTGNLLGRLGYNFNKNFAVEAEGSIGIFGVTQDGVDIDTPYTLGAFAVAKLPITKKFDVFGRVGYSLTNLNVEVEGFEQEFSENFSGIGFGGGIEYSFNDLNGIRLGYTYQNFDDGDELELGNASVFDLSYVRKF